MPITYTIKLYQDCILTNDYKEVISNKYGALTNYLASLTYLTIYSGDEIYFTNNGTITIDNSGMTIFTANKYNYMSYSDGSYTRYAFIKSIILVNELAVIEYQEDLYSNYGDSIKIKTSMLDVSKFVNYPAGNTFTQILKELPSEYISNRSIKVNKFYSNTTSMAIIVNMSLYKTGGSGEITAREFHTCLLKYSNITITQGVKVWSWKNSNSIINAINNIYAGQSTYTINNNWVYDNIDHVHGANWNLEITSIKLIPQEILTAIKDSNNDSITTYFDGLYEVCTLTNAIELLNPADSTVYQYDVHFCALDSKSIWGYENTGLDFNNFVGEVDLTLDVNYKTVGIGNYSRIIPYKYYGNEIGGTPYILKYLLQISEIECRLFFGVNDELIDVTQDYTYTPPINVVSADITYAQNQTQQLAELNSNIKVWQTVFGALGLGGGLGGAVASGTGNVAGGIGGILSYGLGAYQDTYSMFMTKDKRYKTNTAIASNNASIHNNFCGGLLIFEIDAINEDQVNALTTRYGYRRSLLINSDSWITSNSKSYQPYQYVKFDTISLYGEFSQDVAESFRQMFLNGTTIYYNEATIGTI